MGTGHKMKRKLKIVEECDSPQKLKKQNTSNGASVDVLMLDRLRGSGAMDMLKELATDDQRESAESPIGRFIREGGGAKDLLHLLVDVDKAKAADVTVVFNACEK